MFELCSVYGVQTRHILILYVKFSMMTRINKGQDLDFSEVDLIAIQEVMEIIFTPTEFTDGDGPTPVLRFFWGGGGVSNKRNLRKILFHHCCDGRFPSLASQRVVAYNFVSLYLPFWNILLHFPIFILAFLSKWVGSGQTPRRSQQLWFRTHWHPRTPPPLLVTIFSCILVQATNTAS